jgi:hypothetical protein
MIFLESLTKDIYPKQHEWLLAANGGRMRQGSQYENGQIKESVSNYVAASLITV